MPHPAAAQPLAYSADPLDVLAHWPTDQPVLLLHSARPDPRWARRTILATPEKWLTAGAGADPAADQPFRKLRHALHEHPHGLWIGSLAYDLGRAVERLPDLAADDRHWPALVLGYSPGWLEFDPPTATWCARGSWCSTSHAPEDASHPGAIAIQSLRRAHDAPTPTTPATPASPSQRTPADALLKSLSPLRSTLAEGHYLAAAQRVLEYIRAGDVFQVNLTQRLTTSTPQPLDRADTRALYAVLSRTSPAWYGAYLELPGDRVLASISPELFLEVDADGRVITRPIKGTRPAAEAHENADVPAAAEELARSEKDAAELHMIVDLLRNDLGRVCDYGSIRVTQPRTIESHPTVHHGVATIEGRLHRSRDLVDLLRAAMPGGSITGAPKVRAMQIIEELEPVRRGPYCGAIGWMSGSLGACLNIAIRTMAVSPDPSGGHFIDMGVGGGIVADSTPEAEYRESLDKARAMLAALSRACPGWDAAQTPVEPAGRSAS